MTSCLSHPGKSWNLFDFMVVCLSFSHCLFFVWPLQVIHDFLFSLKESPEKFQIEANFPRRVLPCIPSEEWPNPPTLQEAGLSHTEVLFVQDLTDEWHFFSSPPLPPQSLKEMENKKKKKKRNSYYYYYNTIFFLKDCCILRKDQKPCCLQESPPVCVHEVSNERSCWQAHPSLLPLHHAPSNERRLFTSNPAMSQLGKGTFPLVLIHSCFYGI